MGVRVDGDKLKLELHLNLNLDWKGQTPSTGPVVVRLAVIANEREREREGRRPYRRNPSMTPFWVGVVGRDEKMSHKQNAIEEQGQRRDRFRQPIQEGQEGPEGHRGGRGGRRCRASSRVHVTFCC